MEALVEPARGQELEPELRFLLGGEKPSRDYPQIRRAAVLSLAVHAVLILVLASVDPIAPPKRPAPVVTRTITHLYDPPTQLTQKAPNQNKLSKELSIEAIAPRPVTKKPVPAPVARKVVVPGPAPVAQETPVQQAEPPKLDTTAKNTPQVPALQLPPASPPPPPQQTTPPKLAFETPTAPPKSSGPANPAFVSSNPVQEAMRNVARTGAMGGLTVGDTTVGVDASAPGVTLPPSPGRPQSSLELKSDPLGVDFKPYLIRVLATVRRNWFAIYPEAARLGQRGEVRVEFAVAKDGSIPKITYSAQSGSRPLDEAAVAALSASNPLPPLPAEFRGQRVVLQFTFSYNMPRR